MGYTKRLGTVFLLFVALLASACGMSDREVREELLVSNPLANPTLSFADSSRQVTSPGAVTLSRTIGPLHVTTFEFEEGREAEVFEEINAQAEAAGFELERVSSEGRLPLGQWVATSETVQLRILIAPGGLQVELV